MLIEIIIVILLGCIIGTFTGLIPGIHINLIAIIILSLTFLKTFNPLTLVIFITSMAITHTFVDFIPSIFLGAPDEDSVLSVLPGHKLLLKGKAYHATILTLKGSLTALIIIILTLPFFIFLLPKTYLYIIKIMPFLLIIISIFLITTENKKLWALIIFLLAGFLGIATLNLNINQPLLPLLTGLFGASNIIISIKQKTKIPQQQIIPIKNIKLSKKSFLKTSLISTIVAPFASVLPGLGSAQAAVIGSKITKKLNTKEFLFLLGAINTIVMGISFITIYSINKSRTGAAVAISQLITISPKTLTIIILTIICSGILAFFLTIQIAKFTARKIHTFNYSKISIIILILLSSITIYFSGLLGFLAFITSASLGITTILLKIRRMHLMGSLLIPTILFYLIM